jgi:hypothetical protein
MSLRVVRGLLQGEFAKEKGQEVLTTSRPFLT